MAATMPLGSDRAAGIALALLGTLPLAFRRWRPVWVLAVVVAASLGMQIAADGGGAGPVPVVVAAVALYTVAAYCPRRQAAWAGIATGAVLALPLLRDGGGPVQVRLVGVVVSLGLPALGWVCGAYVSELRCTAGPARPAPPGRRLRGPGHLPGPGDGPS